MFRTAGSGPVSDDFDQPSSRPKPPLTKARWEYYKHATINDCLFNNIIKLKIDVTYDSLKKYIDRGDLMCNVYSWRRVITYLSNFRDFIKISVVVNDAKRTPESNLLNFIQITSEQFM